MPEFRVDPLPSPISPAEAYFDLGTHSFPISTKSQGAQVWFDRGLIWSYAFNHEESFRCFKQAVAHDPTCAMAYWGMSYAAGPNYNKSWQMFDPSDLKHSFEVCYYTSRKAEELADQENVKPVERAIIKAFQARFPDDKPASDFSPLDKNYAAAMEKVFHEFGETEDMDVSTLYVDALMHTALRKMYAVQTGAPIESSPVHKVRAIFDAALANRASDNHPGILHFWIHFMEMSYVPGITLPAADRLRHLVPDGGHIHHMPTHIDVLVGDYRRSIDSNTTAVNADEKYLAKQGAKNFYSFYRYHNYHSLIYAAMLCGQRRVALEATDRMEASITDELLLVESPPLADWMEFFKAVRVHVYIRFGMWKEIIALPLPKDQALYCVTTTMTHYGRGIAYAALGDLDNATRERELYHVAKKTVPPTRKDFPNLITDVLKVADAMLDGEIQYRQGDFDKAFESLRKAIHFDDSLRYTEPWGWMVPTRHAYAALMLEQGHVEEAAQAYAEDLGFDDKITRAHQHRNNVWALHGYHECLVRLGREHEAHIIKQALNLALEVTDFPIKSSCFCRLGDLEPKDTHKSCCS
ncbi:TPR domain protein [Penicillium atrosanguineum]|uniref:TPR domain protein n=1 Tax=Penicillium atrosanguineum TaxID=1132637 RepID=A0A9W9PUY0_9EURO|nr:TPR domain protein [Penicillium atrosanguineum]KAJ5139433.1 TPR domain protein [Penicillium atrosanguineum]KAJ5314866.1 TPR domain protein [Penicillium atrosanguineum]